MPFLYPSRTLIKIARCLLGDWYYENGSPAPEDGTFGIDSFLRSATTTDEEDAKGHTIICHHQLTPFFEPDLQSLDSEIDLWKDFFSILKVFYFVVVK